MHLTVFGSPMGRELYGACGFEVLGVQVYGKGDDVVGEGEEGKGNGDTGVGRLVAMVKRYEGSE